jgi:hypothetical protein
MPPLRVRIDWTNPNGSTFLTDSETNKDAQQGREAAKPTPVGGLRRPKLQSQERPT